mgnify:CR=1 FL=1
MPPLAADKLADMLVRLLTVWLSRLETAPNLDRCWLIFSKTMLGYQLKVTGFSPIASRYAGFSQNKLIYIAFIIAGACAGIAGLGEVSGPIGLLYRDISPNFRKHINRIKNTSQID